MTSSLLTIAALVLLAAGAGITWAHADDASSWDVPLYQSFGDRMDGRGKCRTATSASSIRPGRWPAFLIPSLVSGTEGEPVYEPELNDAARAYARSFATLMTGAPRGDRRTDRGVASSASRDGRAFRPRAHARRRRRPSCSVSSR